MRTSPHSGLAGMRGWWVLLSLGVRLSGLAEIAQPSAIQWKDITLETGIQFTHTDGNSGKHYIVETVSSGLATFDFDKDGKIDILLLNGAPLPGTEKLGAVSRNSLYRNDGGWKFTDVTVSAGLTDSAYHLGVCTADYNNDGHTDIYLSNYGRNILYKNNGNGTFTDVTAVAGVGGWEHVGAGACFFDMDGDGDLDLFAASYVDFNLKNHKTSVMNGFTTYVGPLQYPPTANHLFRNNGNGTFSDVSKESGIAGFLSSGMGVIAADFDNDGDSDLIVANDLRANALWVNDGRGQFKEIGALIGIAYDPFGNAQGNMGVDCADWNNDGWLDFYVTTYQRQLSTLYQNQSGKYFDDVTRATGAGLGSFAHVKWGAGIVDFNNDGHRDLFVACGHLIDIVEQFDSTTSYRAKNILLQNTGRGKFVDVSAQGGDGMQARWSSRGSAFDDLDNDGDVDAVILNSRAPATVLRNDSKSQNSWVQVELRGTATNRDGIGARVRIVTEAMTWIDEVHSGRSYQSDFGRRLHFGLGAVKKLDRIEVKWVGGGNEVLLNPALNQRILITEGVHRVPSVGTPIKQPPTAP